ncbi:hypothetical protein CCHR01_09989 [Colletotrichum chrysophilum]|uniref:Uncharacterized protein n=1 Tax=Colletotrichum chrysophilum TaxID=1836956 RepID=A0AAD9AFT7_9PEZI|nr:hypothetical protein CCHR01_09989 [Colletotrichum chrysophilum]
MYNAGEKRISEKERGNWWVSWSWTEWSWVATRILDAICQTQRCQHDGMVCLLKLGTTSVQFSNAKNKCSP